MGRSIGTKKRHRYLRELLASVAFREDGKAEYSAKMFSILVQNTSFGKGRRGLPGNVEFESHSAESIRKGFGY